MDRILFRILLSVKILLCDVGGGQHKTESKQRGVDWPGSGSVTSASALTLAAQY